MNSSSAPTPHEARFTAELLEQIKGFVSSIAAPFGKQFASTDGTRRYGGYFCIMDKFGQFILLECVGDPDDHKKNSFRTNAIHKCVCLFNRNKDTSALSSWVFRNPEANPPKYGGGICLSNGSFMSFSGYPEEVDEAFCISIAKKFGLLDSVLEREIIRVSNNTLIAATDAWVEQNS